MILGGVPCLLSHPCTCGFLCMCIDVRLVSPNRGTSRSEQVSHHWLQDLYLKTVILQFCQCQPTPSVAMLHDGLDSCSVKPRAIRAYPIIHNPWPPSLEFVASRSWCGASLIHSGSGLRRGARSRCLSQMMLAYQKTTAKQNLTHGDIAAPINGWNCPY
jgi:hypothetical protein